MKKFVLAAVAALSLGIGTAYAAQTSTNGVQGNQSASDLIYYSPAGG